MSPFRLITFDVTGTLVRFNSPVFEQYANAALMFGLKAQPLVLKESFKTNYRHMTKEHPIFGKETGLGWEQWWTKVVKGTFLPYNKTAEDNIKIDKIALHLLKFYETSKAWGPKTGAVDLLEYLKTQNITLGAISNIDPRLHTILTSTGIAHYFDFALSSYEVGFEKPDQRIFREALRRAKVDSSEALHVGNDEVNDYRGALEAGWASYFLKDENGDFTGSVNPKHVFHDLHSVQRSFKKTLC